MYDDPERQAVTTWLRDNNGQPLERTAREWATRRMRIAWQIEDTRDEAARARRIATWAPPVALALAVASAAAFVTVASIPQPERGDSGTAVLLMMAGVALGFGAIAAGVRAVLSLLDQGGHRRDLRRWERTLAEHDDAHTDALLDAPAVPPGTVPGPFGRLFIPRGLVTLYGVDPAGDESDPVHDPQPDLAELGLDDTEETP